LNIPNEIKNELINESGILLPDRYEKDGWERIGNDRGAITYAKGKRRLTVYPYGKNKKWMAK